MTAATPQEQVAQWAGMFDRLSSSYDQTGVPFFSVIADGLVARLAPVPGERALDLGAGRGAATFPLADAVGTAGHVDAMDIAPGMVEATRTAVRERGLSQVDVMIGDASEPALANGAYDLVASSLVVFFLPEPERSLALWAALLRPGGRLGISTFRPWRGVWRSIEEVFWDYHDDPGRPAATEMPEVYATDEGVAGLLSRAGLHDVRTEIATYVVPFADTEEWRRWSLGTAMSGLWMRAPEESHPEILARVGEFLDQSRGPDGRVGLEVDIRYTLGRASAG